MCTCYEIRGWKENAQKEENNFCHLNYINYINKLDIIT